MKKEIIFGLLIFLMISNVNCNCFGRQINYSNPIISPTAQPMGEKAIWAQNLTGGSGIAIDSDLSEWLSLPSLNLTNIRIWLAFDETNVYIACEWKIYELYNESSFWRKSGMDNDTFARWYISWRFESTFGIGFEQNGMTDISIWTASNKTRNNVMYECDEEGNPDNGTLPAIMNSAGNVIDTEIGPKWDNESNLLPTDQSEISDNTEYYCWLNTSAIPDDSQNDTQISIDWENYMNDTLLIEIVRPLDTGHPDDIIIDFTQPLYFIFNCYEHVNAVNYEIPYSDYLVGLDNEEPSLTLDAITDSNPSIDGIQIQDSLLLTGTVYDDYLYSELEIHLSGWDLTFPGYFGYANIYLATGTWSYNLNYDSETMPLGVNNVTLIYRAQYDDPIIIKETIIIEDVESPELAPINISSRYPDGVPGDVRSIAISTFIDDNYNDNRNLTAFLYYSVDGEQKNPIEMIQTHVGSSLFTANLPLTKSIDKNIEYTYFIRANDIENNIINSPVYSFFVQQVTFQTITTAPIDSFTLIINSLVIYTIIIVKKRKKIKS